MPSSRTRIGLLYLNDRARRPMQIVCRGIQTGITLDQRQNVEQVMPQFLHRRWLTEPDLCERRLDPIEAVGQHLGDQSRRHDQAPGVQSILGCCDRIRSK